jgi:hypothetical protein
MNPNRYVWAIDLDTANTGRGTKPDILPGLSSAEISAPGKCATIHSHQGVAYVGTHSKCAAKLWQTATGSDEGRPNVPWVAYRGMTESAVYGDNYSDRLTTTTLAGCH